MSTPHLDKLNAALLNPKCAEIDRSLLTEALSLYNNWRRGVSMLTSNGKNRVIDLTKLVNEYKDNLEVELIIKHGSDFLKRQKGQLKLDSSVLEEFLCDLVHLNILTGLPSFPFEVGPTTAFMSLSFSPSNITALNEKPIVTLKLKDQDFIIGKNIHYKFSPDNAFPEDKTATGRFALAVLAAECKINLDKTMFQEAAGTAARLKQGCPFSQYYILNEYLDMEPEDCRLTAIDNVFLIRHAKRLPFEKRSQYVEVRKQRTDHPIDSEIIWNFTQKIQQFMQAVWYDPTSAISRGSFI